MLLGGVKMHWKESREILICHPSTAKDPCIASGCKQRGKEREEGAEGDILRAGSRDRQ